MNHFSPMLPSVDGAPRLPSLSDDVSSIKADTASLDSSTPGPTVAGCPTIIINEADGSLRVSQDKSLDNNFVECE
jgi:hypothetical protein